MAQLENKVAVITGGIGSLGLAIAQAFLHEGAKVLLVDQQAGGPALLINGQPVGLNIASYFVADIRDPAQVENCFSLAIQRYGRIDVFVANAGTAGSKHPIWEYPLEEFDNVLSVNLRALFLGIKSVIPHVARRGGASS